jgi:hypothetical protein
MPAGVGLSTPPLSLLKTADAFTQKYFVPVLSDAVFKPSPTYWRLTRKGRKIHGGAIVVPVVFKEEDSGGAYWGAQVLDTTVTDSVQPAQWEWKQYYQSIVIPYTDVILNSGPTGVLDLIKVKEEIAMGSLLQKLSRAIYKTSPQNTSIDLDSLNDAVAADTNVYAGIDRNAAGNSFWKPVVDATAEAISLAAFQRVYGKATFGNEEPDTILTTQAGFDAFHQLLVANIRYPDPDEETTRAGFRRNLVYNNAVVLHDQFVAGGMYFLNSKYIDMCFHESDYFVVDPFLKPSNQRILVSGIYVTGNLKVWNPRMQAAHTGFTND